MNHNNAHCSDYIKREDAIEQARRNWTGEGDWIASTEINLLKNLPTADVVEVVRCKDCKYHAEFSSKCNKLNLTPMWPNDFCSYGERVEE